MEHIGELRRGYDSCPGASEGNTHRRNALWKTTPQVINETVKAVKNYLDGELDKYETWELFNVSIKQLFITEAEWRNTKSKGAGQTTILKFLGGNWKQWMIQGALSLLRDIDAEKIDM